MCSGERREGLGVALALVAGGGFAFDDVLEFARDELTTDGRDTIGEDMTLDMVVFVLEDTAGEAIEPFFVRLERLIEVVNLHFDRTNDIFGDSREGETTFRIRDGLGGFLDDLGIDEGLLKVGTLGIVFGKTGAIDYEETEALANLRSG